MATRMRRQLIRIVVLSVLATLLAGCAAAAPPSGSPPEPTGVVLDPGTYSTRSFGEPLTFTLPAGWENPSETELYLLLRPAGSDLAGVHVFLDPLAASQDPACPALAAPDVGASAAELSAWIRLRPGLAVVGPTPVSLGGLSGFLLDIGIRAGWSASCPFANGLPTVPLITKGGNGYHWVVAGNERLRLYLLDRPGGGTVAVDIDAFDGRLFDDLVRDAQPVVDSFSFTGG
jgi:hypothetical protein